MKALDFAADPDRPLRRRRLYADPARPRLRRGRRGDELRADRALRSGELIVLRPTGEAGRPPPFFSAGSRTWPPLAACASTGGKTRSLDGHGLGQVAGLVDVVARAPWRCGRRTAGAATTSTAGENSSLAGTRGTHSTSSAWPAVSSSPSLATTIDRGAAGLDLLDVGHDLGEQAAARGDGHHDRARLDQRDRTVLQLARRDRPRPGRR